MTKVPGVNEESDTFDLTFLIPCLNEENTIASVVQEARSNLSQLNVSFEILVVDNNSEDSSVVRALNCGARVISEERRGYGRALRRGISAARGRLIIFADGDLSYDLSELSLFVEKLNSGSDLVVGNRFLGGIDSGAMPWLHKYVGNPILSFLGRKIYGISIGDFHCGLRGFRKSSISEVKLTSPGMEFASEIIVKFALKGLHVSEVPTRLRKDGRARSSHLRTWVDGWRHLIFLMVHAPTRFLLAPCLLSGLWLISIIGLQSVGLLADSASIVIQASIVLGFLLTSNLFWFAVLISGISYSMNLGSSANLFQKVSSKLTLNRVITFSALCMFIAFLQLFLTMTINGSVSSGLILFLILTFSVSTSSILGSFATHLIKTMDEDRET